MRRLFLKLSLFFLILCSLFACNQAMLGTGYAVKNFITAPYRGIKGAIANHSYNKLVNKTENAHKEYDNIHQIECTQETNLTLDPETGAEVVDLRNNIRALACSCKAWGSCTKNECSCEFLCPKTLELLKRTDTLKELSSEKNSLAFRNPSPWNQIGENHSSEMGHCWGHASTTSKFNRLAFFDKSKKPPFSLSSNNIDEQNQAIEYYKKKINDVLDNKATDIEGFSNLNELSDHPALQGFLGDRIAEEWASNAMTFQGLFTSLKSKPMSERKNRKFIDDVKRKLDNHEQPQIVFTGKNSPFFTHAVLVSHYEVDKNGKTILCLRDNNSSPITNLNCENAMFLKDDGEIEYTNPSWNGIGGIKIAHNDNREALAQVNSLHTKCTKDKGCDKED